MAKESDILKDRTQRFALRIVAMYRALPRTEEARKIGKQEIRSGTSIGANYRVACRARSRAEFVAKLGVVLEKPTRQHSGWTSCAMQEFSLLKSSAN